MPIAAARTLTIAAALIVAPTTALAQAHDHAGHDMPQTTQPATPDPHAGHTMPAPAPEELPEPHGVGPRHDHAPLGVNAVDHLLGGPQGAYPMTRDASGTSWQPDASTHGGVMRAARPWSLMGHAQLNLVYDWQDGPRGDEKTFLAGMIMGAARRELSSGTLNFRAMLSPDPFMGKRGYPLHLAAGETADGATTLVDRQHPHELFMELSASLSHRFSAKDSIYVYAGLPGEPAFGPPAFMHRMSAMDSPEAPITHHWLDSTHITFGVLTAGYVHDNAKIEVSSFRGREPDQDRYDIETPELDSTAVRVSWNPTENLALQASWADVTSPEQLHPDEDETRYSASAIYTVARANGGFWSTTAAFGRKERTDGAELNAGAFETALRLSTPWTLFARAEIIETDELGGHHAAPETVGKASFGAIRDFRVNRHAVIGVGGLYTKNFVPGPLEAAYDGDPQGAMAFVRLKIG